jgi:hypothetical protein
MQNGGASGIYEYAGRDENQLQASNDQRTEEKVALFIKATQ